MFAKINKHLETAKKKGRKREQMTLSSPAPQSEKRMQFATLQLFTASCERGIPVHAVFVRE